MGIQGPVLAGAAVVVPAGGDIGMLGMISMKHLIPEVIPGQYTQCLALFWHLLIPMWSFMYCLKDLLPF